MNDSKSLVPADAPAQTQGTSLAAAAAGATALQQAMFSVAVSKPRDMDRFAQKLVAECKNFTFADKAIYDLPFGEGARGPTIRFAEGIARHFENFGIDCVIASDTPTVGLTPGFVVIRNVMIDYERRRIWTDEVTVEKTVERSSPPKDRSVLSTRFNSDGNTTYIVPAWPHEMVAKINIAKSKSQRNLILKLVDQTVLDACKAEIRATCEAKANRDPDEARKAMIDGFAQVGVPVEELTRYVGQDLGTLSPAQIVDLRELWSGIDEGACTWADALADKKLGPAVDTEGAEEPTPVGGLMDRIRARQGNGNGGASQKPPEQPAHQEVPPQRTEQAVTPKVSKKDLLAKLGRLIDDSPPPVHEAVRNEIRRLGKTKLGDMTDVELAATIVLVEKEISRESH